MPTLQVRELPERLYRKLVAEARREHRSLAQQAVVALERGLGSAAEPKERRRAVLRRIAERPAVEAGDELRDPAELVREDRER